MRAHTAWWRRPPGTAWCVVLACASLWFALLGLASYLLGLCRLPCSFQYLVVVCFAPGTVQLPFSPARTVISSTNSERAPTKKRTGVPTADPRTLFVKREGDAAWAEVVVDSKVSVARLTKEIVTGLKIVERLSTLTLHVAKDRAGADVEAALDSRATVAAAGLENGASIVVKVACAGSAASSAASLDASGMSAPLCNKARCASGVRTMRARSFPLAPSTLFGSASHLCAQRLLVRASVRLCERQHPSPSQAAPPMRASSGCRRASSGRSWVQCPSFSVTFMLTVMRGRFLRWILGAGRVIASLSSSVTQAVSEENFAHLALPVLM
jgi:hypothetical protein